MRASRPLVRRDRVVLCVVEHLGVDLVREDPAPLLGEQRRNLRVQRALDDPAGRIRRRVQDHQLRPRRQTLRKIIHRKRKPALLRQRKRNRGRARPADQRLVDREARVRIDHLVTGIASRNHTEEQKRLRARRNQDARGVDRQTAMPRQMLGARLAQNRQPLRRAIVRLPVAQRPHRRLDNVTRRVEVRLADLQVDHPPPLRLQRLRPRKHFERGLGPETIEARRKHPPTIPQNQPEGQTALRQDDMTVQVT